jgi:hypothetical protein
LQKRWLALEFGELPMTLAALLIAIVAQAPVGPATVSGQVVDSKGQPAPGVEVLLSGWPSGTTTAVLARAKSGPEGRFRIDVPTEKDPIRRDFSLAVWAYDPNDGIAGQTFSRSAPPAPGSVTLKLEGPAQTAVRVVGPDGRPVPTARLVPKSVNVVDGTQPRGTQPRTLFGLPDALADLVAATTDARGNATIRGVRAERIEVISVDAAGFGRQLSGPGAGQGGVHTITLKATGRVIGRVVIDEPGAARSLEVVAFTMPTHEKNPRIISECYVTTDADGRFEIPAIAAGKLAINMLPAEGRKLRSRQPIMGLSVEPGKTTEVTIPAEGPLRERTVAGRVVDSSGRPVAAAQVFQTGDSPTRTEAETSPDGRFRLTGVAARPTFVFARKAGYRFSGRAITAESADVAVSLHRIDEPPAAVRKTLPPPLTREAELAMARRLLDPYAERVLKQGRLPEKVRTLEALAAVEPERCLDLIQKNAFNNPMLSGMIGLRVAIGMMDESVEDALTVVEGLEDPGMKTMGYLEASARLGDDKRARALELLDHALLNARAARGPDGIKLLMMGEVAERFLDLGQTERGRALLREGEAVVKTLPKGGFVGYARGAFAEELVQIDPEAALELVKDLSDAGEFDRHHGNMAHELAGRDPALAERALAMVKDLSQRDQYAVRVLYRMAPLDLARARRLAEAIDDECLKGFGLGMMALRLAETGKDSARGVLESAYDTLEHAAAAGKPNAGSLYSPAPTAGALLPVTERIDPKLVEECLERALAMRWPVPWETYPSGEGAYIDVQLAMMLARYDRSIARSLIEPIIRGTGSAPAERLAVGVLYAAAATIDPRWAVEAVEALPDDPGLAPRTSKNAARLAVANVLGRAGERRFRYLQQSLLNLWVTDVEDINPYD